MRTFCSLIALTVVPHLAFAAGEDVLEKAKRLYDAAGYEEALSTLTATDDASPQSVVQVQQYRALCFIALGRTDDAERAIGELVAADPLYVPPDSLASPKVLSFISNSRSKALPAVARTLLDTGRTAFTEKNFDLARENFALLLRLLDDEAMQGRPDRDDLRALASGFAALTAASANAAPPPPAAESKPAERPAPVSHAIIPAVPLKEELPTWAPDRFSARQEYSGTLQLQIGTDGRVKSARMQDPSHPTYDARVLQLARAWTYKPATQAGKPVESERLITFTLRPPQ
jgi:TonB family protein